MEAVLIALISAGIPAITTIITSHSQKRLSRMHSAKQSILQMQMEDVISVELLHKLPYNHENIYYEYDNYKKDGGNSDIDKKMKEYEKWYEKVEEKVLKGGK